MRITVIIGSAALFLSLLTGGAMAQNTAVNGSVSGSLGATTCSAFAAMSPADQASMVAGNVTPSTTTLATNTNNANSGKSQSSSSTNSDNNGNAGGNASAAVTPVPGSDANGSYTAGQVVAACQAASPSSTVQDALSHFKSSPSTNDSTKGSNTTNN